MLNPDSRTLTPSSTHSAPSPKEGSDVETRQDPAFKVTLTDNDGWNPHDISLLHKWIIVNVISQGALCVACASSTAAFTEVGLEQEFNVSHEIAILSISIYVIGLGMGPLLAGPLSEVYGRNIIYQVSYILFFIFSWPVAFAKDIYVFLIFRFVTGLCGAAFLSVAGGSVSDLFMKDKVASPMAFYTIFPFLAPVIGPLLSGFMNQHIYWRWTYYLIIIWSFVMTIALLIFVPETYAPVILRRKAERLRKETGELRYWTEYDDGAKNLGRAILFSLKTPFLLLLTERMALLLNIWTSLMLGILYLAFQAFPIIFMDLHGFSVEFTGMSFLGIGIGMIIAWATQPLWNRQVLQIATVFHDLPHPSNSRFANIKERYAGDPPPEVHLDMGKLAGILVAISLFWLAFTSYRQVHWIVPIIASVPFGSGTMLAFNSVFTYLVTAYRPVAASAMASNSAMRSTFAAVFPLFAQPMYMKLGTVGATALLGGLATLMAPLPFIFSRIGGKLRTKSRFAA